MKIRERSHELDAFNVKVVMIVGASGAAFPLCVYLERRLSVETNPFLRLCVIFCLLAGADAIFLSF